MKIFFQLVVVFFLSFSLGAQKPNWAQDIAPIFYNHCTNCHNPKGIAPISLMNYEDCYNKRVAIKNEVANHLMPPWPPDPNFRRYGHERLLTPGQIRSIVDWINAGAPSGDTTKSPSRPAYIESGQNALPDWTDRIPDYTVTDSIDVYRCFVIPTGLLTDKYISELEVIPGNRSMVHHVLVFQDTSTMPLQLDEADPAPGYTSFSGTESSTSTGIGAWAPGTSIFKLPAGLGILLRAQTNIVIQIHYSKGSKDKTDSTRINMRFSKVAVREVNIGELLDEKFLDNGPLYIPANTVKTFTAHTTFDNDYSLLSICPHMHLIGHSISCWAVTPSGETIPLVDVKDWDFHWQGFYEFQKLQKIPAGSVLYSSATYDNTIGNHDNPNHPPKDVSQGKNSTDEMMVFIFFYTLYQPGDENIVQDSSILNSLPDAGAKAVTSLFDPHPDSLNGQLKIEFYLSQHDNISLSIYDESGKFISAIITDERKYSEGLHTAQFDHRFLKPGIYFLKMETKDETFVRRLIKT